MGQATSTKGVGSYLHYLESIGRKELPNPELSTEPNGDCSFSSVNQSEQFSRPMTLVQLTWSQKVARRRVTNLRRLAEHWLRETPFLLQYVHGNVSRLLSSPRCPIDDNEVVPQTAEAVLKLIATPYSEGVSYMSTI